MDGEVTVRLAEVIGGRPLILLAILAVSLVAALLALFLVGRWVGSHLPTLSRWLEAAWGWLMQRRTMQAAQQRHPALWSLAARLTPHSYLVFHLVVGLVVSGAVLLFLALARGIAGDAQLARFDLALANAIYNAVTPTGVRAFVVITAFGSVIALFVLAVIVGVTLLARGERLLLVGWIIGVSGGGLLNWGLKAFFQRTRPVLEQPLAVAASWSFPSGHAMATFVTVGALAYLLFLELRSPAARLSAVAVALVWVLIIGFSRLYLGVHYFSDVIAGYVAGTVWLGAWISGMEIARRLRVSRRPAPAAPTVA